MHVCARVCLLWNAQVRVSAFLGVHLGISETVCLFHFDTR